MDMCVVVILGIMLIFLIIVLGSAIWEYGKTVYLCLHDLYLEVGWLYANGKESPKFCAKTADAMEKMDILIREIVKARYCKIVLNNPPMDDATMEKRMEILKDMEIQYPKHRRKYSPTRYYGFDEQMAIDSYGTKNWYQLKRTMSLTRSDSALDRKKT